MSNDDRRPPTTTNDSGIPVPSDEHSLTVPMWWAEAAEIGRYAYELHADDDDFVQPRALYQDVMNDADRDNLVGNIVAHAGDHVTDDVQRRVVQYWTNVDPQLGARVAAGLGRGDIAQAA